MKTRRKNVRRPAAVAALALLLALVFSRAFLPPGAVGIEDIVSYCVGDTAGDGTPELLVVSGRGGKTDGGERCGRFLLVCGAPALDDLEELGYIPAGEVLYRIDLSDLRPLKVQFGDINGDGVGEVAVCVYKTAKFHPVMAKRPFFFDLVDGNLIPVWLGSRLSRPFDDYILRDLDSDGIDELVSIEQLEDGARTIAVYGWRGFGFELRAQSEAFDAALRFDSGLSGKTGEIGVIFPGNREPKRLEFRLYSDTLISTEWRDPA